MSDLSVFDVQQALREHARFGHDALSRPDTVRIGHHKEHENSHKPYGIVVGNDLTITDPVAVGPSAFRVHHNALSTFLLHGENYLGSAINSWIGYPFDEETGERLSSRPTLISRNVAPMFPTVHRERGSTYSYSHRTDNPYKGYLYSNEFGKDREHGTDSIHDVLENHRNTAPEYLEDRGFSVGKTNTIGWDLRHALRKGGEIARIVEPFSNLIPVTHVTGRVGNENISSYVYDPSTEQLIRHG